jgi:hypothetical protein
MDGAGGIERMEQLPDVLGTASIAAVAIDDRAVGAKVPQGSGELNANPACIGQDHPPI